MYTCTICQLKIFGRASMLQHLNSAHETQEKFYYCCFCPKKFTVLQTLKLHRLNRLACSIMIICEDSNCDEKFWDLEKYEEHLQRHAEGKERKAIEGKREVQLDEQANISMPMKTSTSEENNSFFSGNRNFELLPNEQSVLEPPLAEMSDDNHANRPKKKIHRCSKCNWCFLDPDLLKLHDMVHIETIEKDRFFQCPKCDVIRSTLKTLQFHYEDTHGRTNVHFYECLNCGKKYTYKRSLKDHKDKVHGQNKRIGPSKIDQKWGFRAKGPGCLELHMNRHNEDELTAQVSNSSVSVTTCKNREGGHQNIPLETNDNDGDVDWSNDATSPLPANKNTDGINEDLSGVHRRRSVKNIKRKKENKEKKAHQIPDKRNRHRHLKPKKHSFNTKRNLRSKAISTTYTCTACSQQFRGPTLMLEHLNTAHETQKKSCYCWFCPQKFTLFQTLEIHRLDRSACRNMFHCEDSNCNEKFWEMEKYEEHLKQHITIAGGTQLQLNVEASTSSSINTSTSLEKITKDGTQLSEPLTTIEAGVPQPSTYPEQANPASDQSHQKGKGTPILHCSKCKWCFLDSDLLELHEMVHTERTQDNGHCFKCPKCVSFHITIKALKSHYSDIHGKTLNDSSFQCPECEHKIPSRKELVRHVNHHKKKNMELRRLGTSLICQECGFHSKGLGHLKRHIMLLHNVGNMKACICKEDGCGIKFRNAHSLASHKNKFHKAETKYVCPYVCGSSFVNMAGLTRHMTNVHPKQTLVCDICGINFKRSCHLEVHKRNLHNPNGPIQYVCSECGMSFRTESGLSYHVGSIHTPNDEKRYGCRHCPKRYHREHLLKLHLKTCAKKNGVVTGEAQGTVDG